MKALRLDADPVTEYFEELRLLRDAETAATKLRVRLVQSWVDLSPSERGEVERVLALPPRPVILLAHTLGTAGHGTAAGPLDNIGGFRFFSPSHVTIPQELSPWPLTSPRP